ncbi:hypothetical protein ACWG0P_12465 [Amedibacillus sp. YH-ame6]
MFTPYDYIIMFVKFFPFILIVICIYLLNKMNLKLDAMSKQLSKLLNDSTKK